MPKKKQEVKEIVDTSSRVEDVSLVKEMETSYLDYAMSVIVSRALPDVRDGLKPVHRRILYAMHRMGVHPGGKYRKSAAIVGDVMGKYHPHGNAAIYDAMVRMAQDFSMRYPLIWGQGNFGSMDGDPAAAERYTEAKLQKLAQELLSDIEKETVNFSPNYDGSIQEPTVLPTKLPNLLLNGNMGIAVGMATNIPPHNLREVCDAIMHLIDNPNATLEDLMQFVQGPDFPTGGSIFGKKDIATAYATGKGGILMRGKAEIIEEKGGYKIIITQIPYQVNKAQLVEKIANLVREKKLEGIKYLGDETNKEGIRVVIELKKDAYPQKVLNLLYKMTPLQDTFHVNMVALAGGIDPQIMPLKRILEEFIVHRKEVIVRRTKFDLAKAEARAHILEGLKKALDVIDQVIKTIKASKQRDDARDNLMKKFGFSEIQANAILDMRLQQLANLETKKIVDELKEKLALIKDLKSILASEKKILDLIKGELTEEMEKYGDERRTKVVAAKPGEFSAKDLIPEESTLILMTKSGYIKRMPSDTFKSQGRGGKGVIGLTTKEDDSVFKFLFTTTHNDLLFFTSAGRVFQLKAYEVPQSSRTAKGTALVNFLSLTSQEKVTAILSLADLAKDKFIMMVTKEAVIKKVDIAYLTKIRKSGLIAIKLHEGDELQWVEPTSGKDDIMIVTSKGQSIRFKEEGVRAMGRTAAGVRGIKLKSEDYVVSMDVITKKMLEGSPMLLVITEKGYGKRTSVKQYKIQGRGGSGIKTANVSVKTGRIVNAMLVDSKNLPEQTEGDIMLISAHGQVIRFALTSVPSLGRATQGVKLMRFKIRDDQVTSTDLV